MFVILVGFPVIEAEILFKLSSQTLYHSFLLTIIYLEKCFVVTVIVDFSLSNTVEKSFSGLHSTNF